MFPVSCPDASGFAVRISRNTHAYFCYEKNGRDSIDESKNVFKKLREIPMSYDFRNEIKRKIKKTFTGTLNKIEASFAFIQTDGLGERIFIHKNNIDKEFGTHLVLG